MPKISVIIPIYNSQDSLRKVIESFINQTFKDFELLLIDDGSTDNSSNICDEFANIDNRIRVFHQKNQGVAMARQTGINNARGEYSIHADSDDWVENHMLEKMYATAKNKNADIVIANYFTNSEKNKEVLHKQNLESDKCIEILYQIVTGKLFGALWNKLIRHSLYKKFNVQFYMGLNYYEDVLVLIQLLQHNNIRIIHLDEAYYHYCINNASISHNISIKTYKSLCLYQEKMNQILPSDSRFSKVKEEFAFAPFEAAFINQLFPKSELHKEFKKLRPLIFKYKKGKRLLGYILIIIGLDKFARRLLKF